jgi:hypothetical protein
MLDQQDIERIQFKMKRIRGHLDDDLQRIQEDASQLMDWKYYLRRHPFASVAAVAAAGFMLIPRSKPPAETRVYLDPDVSREVTAGVHEVRVEEGEPQVKQGMMMALGTLALNTLIKVGMNYATQQVRNAFLGDFQTVKRDHHQEAR